MTGRHLEIISQIVLWYENSGHNHLRVLHMNLNRHSATSFEGLTDINYY